MRTLRSWPVVLAASGVCALLVAFIPVTIPLEDPTGTPRPTTTTGPGVSAASSVGLIMVGQPAVQQFPAAGTRIHSIRLSLVTYQRTNHGTAEAVVQAYEGGQWQILARQIIEKEHLKDAEYYTLTFTPQLVVAKKQPIRLTVHSEDDAANAISWWVNTAWQPDGYALTFNDHRQEGTAAFQVEYAVSSAPLILSLGPIWHRLTLFLHPLWQITLVACFGLMIASIVALAAFRR